MLLHPRPAAVLLHPAARRPPPAAPLSGCTDQAGAGRHPGPCRAGSSSPSAATAPGLPPRPSAAVRPRRPRRPGRDRVAPTSPVQHVSRSVSRCPSRLLSRSLKTPPDQCRSLHYGASLKKRDSVTGQPARCPGAGLSRPCRPSETAGGCHKIRPPTDRPRQLFRRLPEAGETTAHPVPPDPGRPREALSPPRCSASGAPPLTRSTGQVEHGRRCIPAVSPRCFIWCRCCTTMAEALLLPAARSTMPRRAAPLSLLHRLPEPPARRCRPCCRAAAVRPRAPGNRDPARAPVRTEAVFERSSAASWPWRPVAVPTRSTARARRRKVVAQPPRPSPRVADDHEITGHIR